MIRRILYDLDQLYVLILVVYIVLSWFPASRSGGAMARTTNALARVTEPVLTPVRRLLPSVRMGGMGLDLSPIIVFVVLEFVVPRLIYA